jgi:hypothetical protein
MNWGATQMTKSSFFRASAQAALAVSFITTSSAALAGPELSAGTWWVYQNTLESDFADDQAPSSQSSAFSDGLDSETGGSFADPAFILYATDDGSHGPWHFQSEMRIGTGSFSDAGNNNSGDNFTMHKAWIGYDLNDSTSLKFGKSQVPFGWKTVNFWPGDILQAGYGDQMDIGLKLSGEQDLISYDVAYYHQDDWGETSTDTVDDNGHWGSSTTYRKIKTGVANVDLNFTEGHTVGVSYQVGRMQDLAAATAGDQNDTGEHDALDVHYYMNIGDFVGKYRYIDTERDFSEMNAFLATASAPTDDVVANSRHAVHLGTNLSDQLYVWFEGSSAKTDTTGNNSERIEAYAPGVRYDYGPGWLYLEYLWQNGGINRNGEVYEADFRTVYASFDFYF